jgi:peptide/nickel transport system permease protein
VLALFLRRLLWLIPTLFAVSILLFWLFSFAPDASADGSLVRDLEVERVSRRTAFADLPRFLNTQPEDVETRTTAAMRAIAADGPDAEQGRRTLARLGGAALPYVIPSLDSFDPDSRARVATALAPVARRMRLLRADDAENPATAAAFWTRYWSDRSVDFRPSSVRTSVERLARYRTASRAAELAQLDTFALAAIMAKLTLPTDADNLEVARVLVDAAAHATGHKDRIDEQASLAEARACVGRWHRWWLVFESDFVAFTGTARASATLSETRYGKWATGVVLALTIERDETKSRVGEISKAAPVTLALVFGGIAIAYALGTTLGALAAVTKRRLPRVAAGAAIVALHSLPTATIAVLLLFVVPGARGVLPGVLLVAVGLLASPAQKQRDALAGVFVRDFVRAARARGAGEVRAVIAQGLRQGLLGTIALVSIEPPATLGAAFVAEQVLGLDGLGRLTVRAVAERDVTFLMGLVVCSVLVASLLLLASDVIQSSLDPRLRGRLVGGTP